MVKQQKTLDTEAAWIAAFGQRLERARGRTGLTQAELAGSDLSKSFVSLLETARSYPSVDTLMLLARRTSSSLAGLVMDGDELRLEAALSVIALARDSVWSRPAWASKISRVVEELVPDTPLWMKVEVTIVRGIAATLENRLTAGERLARGARLLAEQAGFVPGQAHALALLGYISFVRRHYSASFKLLGKAVDLYRECGALRSEPGAKALIWLSSVAIRIGRVAYARRLCDRARALASRLNLRVLEGQALWNLGYIARGEGDLAKAGRLFNDARVAFEDSEDLPNLSEILMNLGALYREQGKLDQALAMVQRSLHLIERLGNLRRRSDAYQELAELHRLRGNLAEAENTARRALEDARKVRDPRHSALSLATLGRIAAARNERRKAIRYLRAAEQQLKALGLRDAWAEVSRDLGLLRTPATPEAEAAQYLAQALNPAAVSRAPGESLPRDRIRRRPAPRSVHR